MKKTLLCMLLALVLLLSACGEPVATTSAPPQGNQPSSSADPSQNETPSSSSSAVAKPEPEEISFVAAAEKLKEANAFQLTFQLLGGTATEVLDTDSYVFQTVKDSNQNQTVRFYSADIYPYPENAVSKEQTVAFFQGNAGYYSLYGGILGRDEVIKIHSQTPFTFASAMELINLPGEFRFDLEAAKALPFQEEQSDGMTRFVADQLTAAQLLSVWKTEEMAGQEAYMDANMRMGCVLAVDADGYLRQISIVLDYIGTEVTEVTHIEYTAVIDQINSIESIPTPDYANDSQVSNDQEYYEAVGGALAYYHYIKELGGWYFSGLGAIMDIGAGQFSLDCYRVKSEINGKPVISVTGVFTNADSSKVNSMIIPAGVRVGSPANAENTVFFFEDAEENVEKVFSLTEEEYQQTGLGRIQAAYYAGQWEYDANGIPVPKVN